MSKAPSKVVDLFSGAGGMSHGFHVHERFQIVAAVDRQVGKPGRGKSSGTTTYCNSTFERNIGIEPRDADLSRLDPSELRSDLGLEREELDVLISCAPCTGFSQKNAQNHVRDDPRNHLVQRSMVFVEEFLPAFFVMENVKELLSGNQSHHFEALDEGLKKLGYDVWAEVHDLVEFGLPQTRKRALVIASRDGTVQPLHPSGSEPYRTVRDTIGHLPALAGGEVHPDDPMHAAPGNTKKVIDRLKAIPRDGGSWADVMNDPALDEETKRYLLIPAMFRARPGSFPDVYGRLWWDRPAVTITRECAHVGNGRYVHPEQNRLLSVREMALLQGFPEAFVFEGPLTAKYNQIGDAVPPLVSARIAKHVAAMMGAATKDQTQSAA